MSGIAIGASSFVALVGLLVLRVPIGAAMLTVGGVGYVLVRGFDPLMSFLKTTVYWRFSTYDLSVIPLFMLMGHFATRAGLSRALFRAASAYLGHHRGGLAMAAVGGCAGFGAICGSSLATAATMSQVALPELRRYRYSGALATGTLAAGGTLGILIPPSVPLVIYSILVEANVATTFQAAMLQGVLAALGYIAAIAVYVRLNPGSGPASERADAAERRRSLIEVWPVLLIFAVVIGGIYLGWFTPTEGAAWGAFGTGTMAFWRGGMRSDGLIDCLLATAVSSAMIFFILLGADIFNAFLGFTRLPMMAAERIGASGLSPMAVLVLIILLYVVLGCLMDSLAMILLTVPIFWPIVASLDFGMSVEDAKLWFGVISLVVIEVGLITPPVGLNVFVINAIAPDVPMRETFRGVLPFLASDALRVALLVLLPSLTLAVPHLMR